MILLDTNVLVAAARTADTNHHSAARLLETLVEPRLVPPTVVAEVCYVLSEWGGPDAEVRFLRDFRPGGLQLAELTDTDVARMADLAERYADLRLGGTDASVIAIAERLGSIASPPSIGGTSQSFAPSISKHSRFSRRPRRPDLANTRVDSGAGPSQGSAALVHLGLRHVGHGRLTLGWRPPGQW